MTNTDLLKRIDALVDAHRDEIVEGLCRILRFRTVSGGPTPEAEAEYLMETEKCLKFIEEEVAKHGLIWRNHANRCAVAQLGDHDKFIGFPVHIDVVPVGEGWTHGPFDGKIADGVIYGRGTQDDKGPVIQTLWALFILKELGLELTRGARVIIGTKEECGDWADIKHYFEVEPEPEFSIVSDADFPIINGEKGMMNVRVAGPVPIDEEPAVGGWRLKSASAGQRANIVPETADLVFAGDGDHDQLQAEVSRFLRANPSANATIMEGHGDEAVVRFTGKSAHGSLPHLGHNAALDLLLYLTQSGFVTDDEADTAEFLHSIGSDLTGKRLDIDSTHDFIGPTTVNLGILDWKDGLAAVTLNIRNTMGLTNDDAASRISRHVEEFSDETGFDFEANVLGRAVNPIYVNPAEYPEYIDALKESYKAVTGRDAKLMAIGGTTYAKAFPRAVCFGPVDPADGEVELAHQVDERVAVDCHLRNVRMYAYALARLCVG